MRVLGSLFLVLGALLLGFAALAALEGSSWSRFGAYLATVVGLFPISWGMLLCWHERIWAGFLAAGLVLVSGGLVVPGMVRRVDLPGLVVAAFSVATAILGIQLGLYRLRKAPLVGR